MLSEYEVSLRNYLMLRVLVRGGVVGAEHRERLKGVGIGDEGPRYYMKMKRLEESGMVERVRGVGEVVYELTEAGRGLVMRFEDRVVELVGSGV